MAKMHELLAVESDTIAMAEKLISEAITTFSKKPDHFKGHANSTIYLSDERQNENTSDRKELVSTVDAKLDHVTKGLVRLYDVLIQRDSTNQTATADLIVNGKTLATKVPGIFLLAMETRLKNLREVLMAIPTLEPAIAWEEDENAGKGIYRSPPSTSFKTEKKVAYVTLAPATDKHPAQVKDWTEDQRVARTETTHFSGMWSVTKKADVLDRLDSLLYGVKQARMRANLAEVVNVNIGKTLLDYVLKG